MRRSDMGLLLGLWIAALTVRLPYLPLIPHYSDEGNDVLWGLNIALGQHLPLTSSDPYNGPLTAYLIAAIFRWLGVSLLWPRLVVALGGATLVVVVYWLASRMGGRLAGLLAASLTLLHPILVTFTSHIAFTSAHTPLFAMLTLATAWEGVQRRSIAWFAATGVCAALMLQTHPTSAVGLVGLVLWLVAQPTLRRPWITSPVLAAVGMGLIGYAPVLVANVRPDSPMLTVAQERDYAFGLVDSLAGYISRSVALARYMVYAIGGIIAPGGWWMQIMAGLIGLLLLVALVYAWRRGFTLLPAIFLATLLLLPLVVRGLSSRYLGGLLPVAHVALGLLGGYVLQRYQRRAVTYGVISLWVGLLALAGLIIVTHYRTMDAMGATNRGYSQLEATLREHNACGGQLYVADPNGPNTADYSLATGVILNAVHYTLTLQDCQHSMVSRQTIQAASAASQPPAWIILPATSQLNIPGSRPILTVQLPTLDNDLLPITLLAVGHKTTP